MAGRGPTAARTGLLPLLPLVLGVLPAARGAQAEEHWFEQLVDHFSASIATYRQRYYEDASHFGGPGSPIFVILGGEGGIPPETGIFYPWVTNTLAAEYEALVIEPEHRYYGASLPFGEWSHAPGNMTLLNPQQALADAAHFIRAQQAAHNCTARGTAGYCPVLTIGGSYPGFLSAMMRLRYPDVVDMSYAASAPVKFYAQEVDQYAYYDLITHAAEATVPGCPASVANAFKALESFIASAGLGGLVKHFQLCTPLPPSRTGDEGAKLVADDLLFLAEQWFANLNMANYPPGNTSLFRKCQQFMAADPQPSALLDVLRDLLLPRQVAGTAPLSGKGVLGSPWAHSGTCLNLTSQLPAGRLATARCGDWSGCGAGSDGESWDYQTCTFCVERIGFGGAKQMFPLRNWTLEWMQDHCARRFGVTPQPRALRELWGFDEEGIKAQSSRILFTNGELDGWVVGGITHNLDKQKGLLGLSIPLGAHHSDLGHFYPVDGETAFMEKLHSDIVVLVGKWLEEVRTGAAPGSLTVWPYDDKRVRYEEQEGPAFQI